MTRTAFLWLTAAIAFIGFIDASFLAYNHLSGVVPPCSVVVGCEIVTTSTYSEIAGIPVAVLGALYYLGIVCLALATFQTGSERLMMWLRRATYLGLFASVYFVSLQVLVIGAICIYCMISAASSTALFCLSRCYAPKH